MNGKEGEREGGRGRQPEGGWVGGRERGREGERETVSYLYLLAAGEPEKVHVYRRADNLDFLK